MSREQRQRVGIIDDASAEWKPHPRFPGILVKQLLTSADNSLASVGRAQLPPGGVIGWHDHGEKVETVYVLAGSGTLTIGQEEFPFSARQIVAIPGGAEHTLRNTGAEPMELLTISTPPNA
jgi:mannose-6-phosphate isomerase-like protein (cupin superfamily)